MNPAACLASTKTLGVQSLGKGKEREREREKKERN
jgi:hypothetical protein